MGNLKIRVPRGGLAESGILERAFWGLQAFQRLSKEINHVLLIGVATMITWSIAKAHQIHWGWQWPSGVNIKGAVYSHGYGDGRLCPLMVWLNKFPVFWYYFTCLMSYLLFCRHHPSSQWPNGWFPQNPATDIFSNTLVSPLAQFPTVFNY